MATLNITIPDADETTKGIAEVSTQAEVDAGTDDERIITPLKLENSALRSEVTANNAKVTNATHTGEVTGSGVLTVDKTAISNKTLVTAVAGDHVLVGDASDSDALKKVNVSDFLGGGTDSVMLEFSNVNGNALADSGDYFISTGSTMGNTVNSSVPMPVPTGTITEAYISTYNGSTFGTAETMDLILVESDGTVVDTISTVVTFDARNRFFTETLNIAVTEGMFFIRLDVPVMATNPTSAKIQINLKIEL